MITALLILAGIVALSILVLLWLCHRAPVIDDPFARKPLIYIDGELADPVPPLDQRFRETEGV